MFMLFFLVFMLAYSVTTRSLAEPNQSNGVEIIWILFRTGLWEIFGETNPEHKEGSLSKYQN
jgi:hypothetical protein